MKHWERMFLILLCIATAYLFFDLPKPEFFKDYGSESAMLNYVCYDTVKYIQPPPTDTCRRKYDYNHSYLKLTGTTYMEIPSIEFHYLYHRNKKGSFDEIGYEIPIDTTIEFFSHDKDTVYFITINKDQN